jgi:hypothetical protein
MLYEDPLDWDRQVQNGHQLVEQYRLVLHVDPLAADSSGPFIGVPFVTTRAAFAKIRELPEGLPLREPLLRWAFRLAEARVNAELEQHLAAACRSEVIVLDLPRPIHTTRANLLMKVVSDAAARGTWLQLLGDQLHGMTESTSLLWQRREELAKRAGFENLAVATSAVPRLEEHVNRWLQPFKANAPHSWQSDPTAYFETALATSASQGWPAHLTTQSMASLLGPREWLRRTVREPRWPQLFGPTSFMRALFELGRELAFAWAASTHPFVMAHSAGGQAQFRLGYLLASLPLNVEWQKRALGLRNDQAREQVRTLANALTCNAAWLCIKVRLARAAAVSASELNLAYVRDLIETFGFELPKSFAGQLPRLDLDDGHRLVGLWSALSDHERLRSSFDFDWFRNPRAIESLLEQSAAIEPEGTEPATVEQHQAIAARWLLECMDG